MKILKAELAIAVLAAAWGVQNAEAAYKRGELLWKCDFTREELPLVNGTNSYLREGHTWIANEGRSGDGALYVKNRTEKNCFMFGIPLQVAKFAGMIQIEADVKGIDLQHGPHDFNGPKIMFPYRVAGRTRYPQLPSEYGSFDWKTWVRVDYLPSEAESFALVLGLEHAAGEFYIDAVRIYRAVEIPDEEASVAPKNPRADALPRGKWAGSGRPDARRGVMSGGDLSEDAFKTLYDWNVNLIRMQIGISTKSATTVEDWFSALEKKLIEVDRVLGLCRKYGLKMAIDLHGGPGCKATKYASNVVPNDYDTTDLKRAWRMIASRYCEDPSIYGYDILNEPACAPETWDRVFRDVVKEIRTIDRKTPVITETVKFWYPDENVIYSPHYYSPHTLTHFGVGGIGRIRWSYNNWINGEFWNKDRIREALAPFIRFQEKHPEARIFIGEFSCILWSKGADGYVNDCVELFDEYGWDWTYHAFREWPPWSVEHEPTPDFKVGQFQKAKGETARLKALKRGFAKNARGAEELVRPVQQQPQPKQDWKLPACATLENGLLTISRDAAAPTSGVSYATSWFDCSRYSGRTVKISVECLSAEAIGAAENELKFMLHFKDAANGDKPRWIEIHGKKLGAAANGCKVEVLADLAGVLITNRAMLGVGLYHNRGGRAKFDLGSLRFEVLPDVSPWRNTKWQCTYPARVRDLPRLRGVMLPNIPQEKDFADLHDLGATLVRYQMNPVGTKLKADATEAEVIAYFDKWIGERLDHLQKNVLGWCRKYGIRLVLDIHGCCGGREPGGEVRMYHNPRYAAHFVETWEKIARRFAGNEDVIYGYDIFNEPVQTELPSEGCDYWTLQKRCGEAIRRHDRKTPVIVECSNWDCPNGYCSMSPLALDNVIYQVHCYDPHEFTHQFVGGGNRKPTAYPFTRPDGTRIDKAWQRKNLQPVLDFQKKHGAKIYVGEFSAITWAEGADRYIRDEIELFEEFGWDWTYHAFREWDGWSVEHEADGAPGTYKFRPSADNPRRRVLFSALKAEKESAARVRYFSNAGDDAADGLTPQTAWKTLEKLAKDLPAGGEARLRRGDVFYGRMILKPGLSEARRTVVSPYGEGPRPVISAYKIVKAEASVWEPTGTNNLWRLDLTDYSKFDGNHMSRDGNVGFLKVDGAIFGRKFFKDAAKLTRQWDFIDDCARVTVWSEKNPALMAKEIKIATNMGTIPFRNHMELRGIDVRGTGAHGCNGVGADVRIIDCGFHEIGGSWLKGHGAGTSRYGNGVECWAGSTDVLVCQSNFSEIYDVGFTMQGRGPSRSWANTHVLDCTFTNCTQCFELWATQCKPGIGMVGCSFQRNLCVDTARGWGYDVRPDKVNSTPLLMYNMATDVCDVLVKDNTFVNSRLSLVFKSGGLASLPQTYRIVDNVIVGPKDQPLAYCVGGEKAEREASRLASIRKNNTFRVEK